MMFAQHDVLRKPFTVAALEAAVAQALTAIDTILDPFQAEPNRA
jgi:hypothetical protein